MTARARTVAECPVWLDVNGTRVAAWTATPESVEALAVGRLLTDGFIRASADVRELRIVEDDPPGTIGIRAKVRDDAVDLAHAEHDHLRSHGCGAIGLVECLGVIRRRSPVQQPPEETAVAELFRALFTAETELRAERGGVHAAALAVRGRLAFIAHDVGRHSAVDKALGAALLAGEDPGAAGLLTTARVSGEIAVKAARGGVAWIASRSVPTTLALRVAAAAGIPILARAASPDAERHDA